MQTSTGSQLWELLVVLTIAFYAVGIKRFHSLALANCLIALYVLRTIILALMELTQPLAFSTCHHAGICRIVGIGRPYIDRWLMKSNQ